MKTIRIGIIGLGTIARVHLAQYKEIPGVEVIAASDIDPYTLESVCNQYQIKNRYTDFKEMLKRDDLDAVDVCLHNHFHKSAAVLALRAGKHVYCEKPIASSWIDGKEMLDTAKECGKMLQVQLIKLFQPETKCAKRLIDDGEIGRAFYARAAGYRRRGRPYVDGFFPMHFVKREFCGGGAIMDMSIYKISQMLYLLGKPEVNRVSGMFFQEKDMYEDLRKKSDYNVEEIGMGYVRFKGNILLDFVESWACNMDDLGGDFIVGSKGGIRLTPELKFISTISDIEMISYPDVKDADARWHGINPLAACYDSPQKHWVAALRGEVPLLNSAEIALDSLLIAEGTYLSAVRGEEVSAEEIRACSKSKAIQL